MIIDVLKHALELAHEGVEIHSPNSPEYKVCAALIAALEAKDEIDWKDMYEKEKRRSEMWVAKYEKDIGPLEKAVPQQEKNEFNPDWDTQAVLTEEIQRMAKRIEELEAKDEPVMIYHGKCTIDCGEHGHHNMEMLKMIPAGSKLYTSSPAAAVLKPGPSGDYLSDFQEDQWWVAELDAVVADGTHDQKRAVAVVRNLLATVAANLAAPPAAQSQWVGLTDEEVTWLCNTSKSHEQTWGMFVRAIEAKLKEKNT